MKCWYKHNVQERKQKRVFVTVIYYTFFKNLQVTLPCPPNPAKAKKAAAIRAAKEAKMKNPAGHRMADLEESRKKEDKHDKNVNRWYMGEYGTNEGT